MRKRLILLCSILILLAAMAVPAYAADTMTNGDLVCETSIPADVGYVKSGDEFTVDIHLKDYKVEIASFSMTMEFDSAYMECESITPGPLFSSAGSFSSYSYAGSGSVMKYPVSFSHSENVISGGASNDGGGDMVLFTMHMKIKSAASATNQLIKATEPKMTFCYTDAGASLSQDLYPASNNQPAAVNVKHMHVYSSTWTEIKAATCTEDGERRQYCVNESCKTSNEGKALSETLDIDNKPYYTSEVLPSLGHKTTLVPYKAATCTEDGNEAYYTCGNGCGVLFWDQAATDAFEENETYVIPAKGHTLTDEEAYVAEQPPSCEEDGIIAHYRCPDCGAVFITVKNNDGELVFEEKDENYLKEQSAAHTELLATGHTYEKVEKVSPTCGINGVIEHYKCSVCKQLFLGTAGGDGVITYTKITQDELDERSADALPALVHEYNAGEVTTEPTCTALGVMTFTCQHCGDTYTEDIPMVEHTKPEDESLIITVQPTGKTEGYIKYTCTVCNQEITEILPPTGEVEDEDDGVRRAPQTIDWANVPLWCCIFAFFAAAIGAACAAKKRQHN